MEESKKFEKEVCKFLNIPSLPKNEWDKKSSFDNGVAIVKRLHGGEELAVCRFNSEADTDVRIIKDFGFEPFTEIISVYPIPSYMEDNITKMTFNDSTSEEAMKALLLEKNELTSGKTEDKKEEEYEFGFPFIKDKKEAIAYLKSKNPKAKISPNIDVIKNKLKVMYHNEQKNKK